MTAHVARVNGRTKNPRWPVEPDYSWVPQRWIVGLPLPEDFAPVVGERSVPSPEDQEDVA